MMASITFNDDVMTGVMNLFLDIVQDKDQYSWVKRSIRKKVYKLAEVDPERRTGYSWYGYWPVEVLKSYILWKKSLEDEK